MITVTAIAICLSALAIPRADPVSRSGAARRCDSASRSPKSYVIRAIKRRKLKGISCRARRALSDEDRGRGKERGRRIRFEGWRVARSNYLSALQCRKSARRVYEEIAFRSTSRENSLRIGTRQFGSETGIVLKVYSPGEYTLV